MTKDEIKKALECCVNPSINPCKDCPYNKNGDFSYCNDKILKDTLNLITEQEKEIEKLKAEFKQLETNAEILARGVRDLNHENYELTEKIKQAKIDVLSELREKYSMSGSVGSGWATIVLVDNIDEMIEELTKCQK